MPKLAAKQTSSKTNLGRFNRHNCWNCQRKIKLTVTIAITVATCDNPHMVPDCPNRMAQKSRETL